MEEAWNGTHGMETRHMIGCRVRVTCTDDTRVEGYLYAVDPERMDVAVVEGCDGSRPDGGGGNGEGELSKVARTCVVMGHAIRHVQVMEDEERCPFDLWKEVDGDESTTRTWDPKVLHERKSTVQEMLRKHGLPFQDGERTDEEETGTEPKAIQVLGCLLIHPPYTARTCESSNELVLTKVRTMIAENMPALPSVASSH